MNRWIVVEILGDEDEEEHLPDFDVFPSSLEIYGDYRVVADWHDNLQSGGDMVMGAVVASLMIEGERQLVLVLDRDIDPVEGKVFALIPVQSPEVPT